MSDTLADLATWLPSEFLTGDMEDKALFLNNHNHHHVPYDLASSPSSESESDDDDIAGLTHRFTRYASVQERLKIPYPLEKKRVVFSGSPESTLNWNVSRPTQTRSSPTTPFLQPDVDSRDLIYVAAVRVARMKMKTNAVNDAVFANRGLLEATLSHHHYLPNAAIRSENEEFIRQQQFRQRVAGVCGGRCGTGGPVGFRQSACTPLPVENQRPQPPVNRFVGKPVLGGFTGGCDRGIAFVKKERAGTGVFLPRNYSNVQPESKKKPTGIAQPLNKNMVPIIARPQPNINSGFALQYQVPPPPYHFKRDHEVAELVMARRYAVMLAQQRRSTGLSGVPETRMGPPEVVLPKEWTY